MRHKFDKHTKCFYASQHPLLLLYVQRNSHFIHIFKNPRITTLRVFQLSFTNYEIKEKTKEEYFYQNFEFKLKSLTNLFFNCSSSSSSILVPQGPLFQPSFLISALMCFSPYKPICKLQSHNLERFLK